MSTEEAELPEDQAPEECCDHSEEHDEAQAEEHPTTLVVESDGKRKVRIAVAGCAHGEMDKIYEVMGQIEKEKGYKFDLLICCGDYQAVRNYGDLHHMHVNEKYRSLQTFYKYYSGEKVAPVLTVFVGGNHEASGYLTELPNGGWVAPKIYYMGYASVIRFAGLRIAGLSGIFNAREFNRGHYERPPFREYGDVIGVYHVRNVDVWRLKHLKPADDDKLSNPIDIMLTHDWPAGIADFGDLDWLFRVKAYFKDDHQSGKLGNPASMKLLYDIRARYWLSAHLHVAFAALVPHKGDGETRPEPTRFLSLDKPVPRRQFVQALELNIADDAKLELSHDPQWLAILRSTDKYTDTTRNNLYLPSASTLSEERWDFRPTAEELAAVEQLGDLRIDPNGFRHTAPPLKTVTDASKKAPSSAYYRNPQTQAFCEWLGIKDLNKMLIDMDPENVGMPYFLTSDDTNGAEEVALEQDEEKFGDCDFILDRGDATAEVDEEPDMKRLKTDDGEEVQTEAVAQ